MIVRGSLKLRVLQSMFLLTTAAWGQVDRATLGGTVSDSSGAVIPGAKIELVSEETGLKREATAGANGQYSFSLLPIGS